MIPEVHGRSNDGRASKDSAAVYEQHRLADGAACLDRALHYRQAFGWSVLAVCPPDHVGVGLVSRSHAKTCKTPGKRPWHTWKEFEERMPTEKEIREWWWQLPMSNLGLALGPVSGVVRLDIEGEAAARQLQELSAGDLPATLEVRSGRADGTGRGILYGIPPGVTFRTTPTPFQDGELRFQAKGAQTVLPPSRHKDGLEAIAEQRGLYQWLPGRSPDDLPLAPAPAWAVERWRVRPPAHQRPQRTHGQQEGGKVVALALEALAHLSAERAVDYDNWLHTGMALHAVSDGDELLDAWDEWSKQGGEKYQPGACAAKWATFSADGGLSLSDLLRWAWLDSGWKPARVFRRRGGRVVGRVACRIVGGSI